MPQLRPRPPIGLLTWAASPARKTRPLAKRRCHALVHVVEIAVHDRVSAGLGEELLQPLLHRVLVEHLIVGFARQGRKHHPPQPASVVARDLEQVRPFVRVGKIAAKAAAAFAREIERRGEHQKALGKRIALECDAECLAHGRAPAVGADQVAAGETFAPAATRHRDRDPIRALLDVGHLGRKVETGVCQAPQPRDPQVGELVLLALHDERIARVVRQHRMIELGDHLAGWAVPELERARDEAARDHVVDQAKVGQHLQRRRMGGGGARCFVHLASASNTRTAKPCRARASAAMTPTGPPPAIRIGSSAMRAGSPASLLL